MHDGQIDGARPCNCDLSVNRPERRIGRGYVIFTFSFSRFSLSFFSIARDDGQWRIPFSRVSLNFLTLLEEKKGKKEKKRKADRRFINFRLFPISPIPHPFIVCGPDENTHAICVCPILILCPKSSFCWQEGGGGGEKYQWKWKKGREKKVSFVLEGRAIRVNALFELFLFIRIINNVPWRLFPPLTLPRFSFRPTLGASMICA